jgi:hypothetical protein
MEWHDHEQNTPSIQTLLYGRGGLLFDENASLSDYDAPEEYAGDEFLGEEAIGV